MQHSKGLQVYWLKYHTSKIMKNITKSIRSPIFYTSLSYVNLQGSEAFSGRYWHKAGNKPGQGAKPAQIQILQSIYI